MMGKVILLVILLLVSHLNMLNWFITHKLEKKKNPATIKVRNTVVG